MRPETKIIIKDLLEREVEYAKYLYKEVPRPAIRDKKRELVAALKDFNLNY